MTFISYAQNFEDVMLWRALKHVENGFYIDVGASDPQEDSVTKAFYDRGWQGINIEPIPEYHQRLSHERPRDINLPIAAGERNGELTLFDVPAVRGWASPDEAVAANHRENGFEVVALSVPVRTLADICDEHVKGEIHFLKIDVECFETEVIRGMDFQNWRPWILVIEATLPNSQVSNHQMWEHMLTAHRYHFAYFDGLNRYYVAEEHLNLSQSLVTQPNVFDDFQTIVQVRALESAQSAEARAQQAEARAQEADRQLAAMKRSISWRLTRPLRWVRETRARQAEAKAEAAQARAREAEAKAQAADVQTRKAETRAREAETKVRHLQTVIDALHTELHIVYSSTSWKITTPIRAVGKIARACRALAHQAVASHRAFAKRPVLALVRRALPVIKSNPLLMDWSWRIYRRFPALGERVLRRAKSSAAAEMTSAQEVFVISDVPSAWGQSVSPTSHFKMMLARELLQRQTKVSERR